ncbi:MAG TPA: TIM barrel protein [Acidobacteriota bacterium]|nr:TIM barrel protein [Acidobacteriota bacterium]
MTTGWKRRDLLSASLAGGVAAAFGRERPVRAAGPAPVKQSVCRWCYGSIPLEELVEEAAGIGYQSIELLNPEEVLVVEKAGLTCAMLHGTGPIHDCLNRRENHERCERELRTAVAFAHEHQLPNVICFSGNRDGMDDEEGLRNCADGLKRVAGLAERMGVTICLELLNSKVDHKGYMADHTAWGVELVKRVGSPRVKLLYDIYHMQIMEGDIIRTIRDNHEYIGHYHTGGVPGRHEIDESQELNYPAVMRAIAETGYDGFVGQEFVPSRDPLASLAQGFRICNVGA